MGPTSKVVSVVSTRHRWHQRPLQELNDKTKWHPLEIKVDSDCQSRETSRNFLFSAFVNWTKSWRQSQTIHICISVLRPAPPSYPRWGPFHCAWDKADGTNLQLCKSMQTCLLDAFIILLLPTYSFEGLNCLKSNPANPQKYQRSVKLSGDRNEVLCLFICMSVVNGQRHWELNSATKMKQCNWWDLRKRSSGMKKGGSGSCLDRRFPTLQFTLTIRCFCIYRLSQHVIRAATLCL